MTNLLSIALRIWKNKKRKFKYKKNIEHGINKEI